MSDVSAGVITTRAGDLAAPVREQHRPQDVAQPEPVPPATACTVLVVEDDGPTSTALVRLLRGAGHTVWAAPDAMGAIQLLREHRPDRVLLDLVLPGLAGEHVLLAARAFSPETRVAVVSGVEDPARLNNLLVLGADRLLRKPVNVPAILNWVAQC